MPVVLSVVYRGHREVTSALRCRWTYLNNNRCVHTEYNLVLTEKNINKKNV